MCIRDRYQRRVHGISNMKGFLIILLATAALCMPRDVRVSDPHPHFIDFVKGFLEGIKETTPPEKILKCLEEGDHILSKIVEALKLIKTMIPTKVIEGVKMLIEALRELFNMLKPCTEGYGQLKKLVEAIAHISIPKVVAKIMAHPGEFVKHITEIIEGIIKKNHLAAGKAFGELLYQLFLSRAAQDEDHFVLFVKGFLIGIKETGDIQKLLSCIKTGEEILKKIIEALKLIKTMNPAKINEGIKMLIAACMELYIMLKPCISGYEQLKKLFTALTHISIPKIVAKIMAHPGEFLKHITGVIEGLVKKEYENAGKAFGELLYQLFLATMEVEPHFVDFVKGFLEGIKETTDPEKLLKCAHTGEELIKKIVEALKLIKTMIPTKVLEGVKLLIAALTELFHMLKPCTEGYEQLKKLITALSHVSIPKVVAKILAHPGEFVKHITDIIEAIVKKDHLKAGKSLGELLFQLFLSAMDAEDHFVMFLKGFLEGIKETADPEKILKCATTGEELLKKIVEALKLIKTMIPTKVMEGVKQLIACLTELFHMLKPCVEGYEQLKKLITALTHVSIPKVVAKILAHPGEFIKHITDIIEAVVKKDHTKAGLSFGELLYQLFLAFRAQNSLSPLFYICLLYTSPSPRDQRGSRMPSSA
eukprot:TRINITY_DN5_c0_g1_i6.p1 TRINITY_DN5_c0_g1~~TRINITY_DN5_c0_g1_i6.p1  ORF type:complete len:649 (-),score=257.56 TRINITY_DN5_c0_g1_i6:28-1974(-)